MRKNTYFDFIDLEDRDASILLAQAKIKKDSEYNAEHNSICPSCEKKRDFLRFDVDADMLICYDCYYESMKVSGEFYSYHDTSG